MSNANQLKASEAFKVSFAALTALEGTLWREVQGEVQSLYNEIPFWVLLYEDSDLRACHRAFAETVLAVAEAVAPMQFTVSYTILKGDLQVTLETLMSNDEIRDAVESSALGRFPEVNKAKGPSVFRACSSGTKPT